MSVLIVTSVGDLVIDLHTDECPLTCKNFLKLCKIKYYNGCVFHTVQKDFTAQTGDPTGTGNGGDSVYKFLYGDQARFFGDEFRLELKHLRTGTVAMASGGEGRNASQFYFTLRDDLEYLDGKHTVFGMVAEGLETLTRINEAYVDEKGRPYKNIRIKHTYILEDPFDDPPQLVDNIPDASPEGKPKEEVDDQVRLEDDWVPMDEKIGTTELEEIIRAKEAHSSAVVLESIGDIPDAEMKPPDNVLFVCKLNPVTEDEDLHTIFSRFGTVIAADIIRDFKTGDSLNYAFIEFETNESCEQAYFKMDNALIDDRRIHVDFSQSVSKLWSQYRRKGNQMGNGCFKCGALDHIAKDCTGEPATKQLPPKYTLKVDNAQHGGKKNSRYDMVFDGDTPTSPQQRKKREDIEHNGEEHKPREENLESMRPPRHRQSDRGRGHKEDEWGRDRKTSRSRRDEYLNEREKVEGEKYAERRDKDKRDERNNGNDRKKYGDRKVHADDDRDDRRRDDRKNNGDRRVHADDDRVDKRRDDRDYIKRDADNYRRDQKDEPSYKKRSLDEGYRKEERDHTRRKGDDDRDTRHQSDKRR